MKVTDISLRKKFALNLFRKYKENESRLHPLNYIFWECTLRCNLNCVHCGSDCTRNSIVKDMPVEDFLKAIDEVKQIVNPNKTTIVLTGGEALLRNDIEKIGISLYKRGFPWGIVTNGMLLTPEKLNRLMNSGLRAITVSLDGLEESHNWLRCNTKSFKNAIAVIKLLSNTFGLQYDVVTCIHRKNYNELHQIRDLLITLGVLNWRIFTVFPIGRAKENAELFLSPAEFKDLFDFIKQTRKEKEIKLNYGCEGFLGSYEHEVRDGFFFCRAGINIASVLVDGSVSACPNLRGNFIQGNIYSDNFADIWQNRYKIFRNREWTRKGICADCNFYSYCEGNGMHLHSEETGELLFCHLKKIVEGEEAGIKQPNTSTP